MNEDKYLSIVANGESFFNPGKLYGDMTIEKLSTDVRMDEFAHDFLQYQIQEIRY